MVKKSRRVATAAAADLMLAPMVAWLRLPVMASEALSTTPFGRETVAAASEKAAAAAEGLVAAQLAMAGSMLSFWPEVLAGRTPSLLNGAAAERSLHAALRPARRRVKANLRRLRPGR
ncbi:hypothetical protein ACTDI4_15415 [Mesorhizobium sp. PUT5]|uniref:hypothetical protein n=1 Tax=Mesorhizobium sp. PUT5 TaxID=3454629 RepID=UPI003FA496A3